MQTFQQTFTGATTWKLAVPGSYFTILDCTNAVSVRFYLGGKKLDLGEISSLLAGLEVLPKKNDALGYAFDHVEVDVSGADTVTIGIGNGEARYNRSAGTVSVSNVNGAFTNTNQTVGVASAQLLAANASRRYLLIQNLHASQRIWVTLDGTAATTAKGILILAGGSYECQGYAPTGAIYAIGETGANAAVVTVEG